MKDQRQLFRIAQQQPLEDQQRVPSLIAMDRAQDRHLRQSPISADLEGQALRFHRRRAAGEAEEKSLRLARTHFPLGKQRSEGCPLRLPWLVLL